MSAARRRIELSPSVHWSSAVLVALGATDPEQLDVLEAVLVHFGARATGGHESPTRVACLAAVDELGAGHALSPLLAALFSALLVQQDGRGVRMN